MGGHPNHLRGGRSKLASLTQPSVYKFTPYLGRLALTPRGPPTDLQALALDGTWLASRVCVCVCVCVCERERERVPSARLRLVSLHPVPQQQLVSLPCSLLLGPGLRTIAGQNSLQSLCPGGWRAPTPQGRRGSKRDPWGPSDIGLGP